MQVEESEKTIQYTTIKGEQVEIPAHPKRVVYIGPTLGDFLVMDIPIVGSNLIHANHSYYEGKTAGIVDVGHPGDLEMILTLKPDLIINSYYNADAEQNEALSKIAPTIPFNPALPYAERVKEMGNIFGQQKEAAQLIAKFETQSQEMWDKLQLAEGETATVFYQLGKTLYVMGNRSLGAIIYGDNGFASHQLYRKILLIKKGYLSLRFQKRCFQSLLVIICLYLYKIMMMKVKQNLTAYYKEARYGELCQQSKREMFTLLLLNGIQITC